MKHLICMVLGHKEKSHLDIIYGQLFREHRKCLRCRKTTKFERCDDVRASQLPLVNCDLHAP